MPELPWANWNGEQMPLSEVRVSVLDRSFLFGDAVYEAMCIHAGRVFLQARHLHRLQRSVDEVRIRCDVDRLAQRLQETLETAAVQEGLVYVQVTRGAAPRTHRFPDPPVTPNELIAISEHQSEPYADCREAGASVILTDDLRWKRCDIKSVNLLGNCLAAQEAAEAGADEAVLVTADGTVTEGSHTSFFGVKAGQILTAPLETNILPGITRSLLGEIAERAGIPLREESLRRETLANVDELFLTGTTAAILPVTKVDHRPVGDGRPGPITLRLVDEYQAYVRSWLADNG